jgi:L-lactate dehydrogenase complex protein LldG
MRSSGRVEFIETIRKALDRSDSDQRSLADMIQKAPDADDVRLLEAIAGRDKASHLALLDRLIDAGKRVNVGVLTAKDVAVAAASVSRIAAEKTAEWGDRKVVVAWDHPFVKKLALETVFKPLGIPVYFPYTDRRAADRKEDFRRHAEKAFIGITSADYCIAETATLTMKTRPGQPRCVSLLPSMHIAIISAGADSDEPQGALHTAKMEPNGAGRRPYPLHDVYHRSQQNSRYRSHPRPWGPRSPGAKHYCSDRLRPFIRRIVTFPNRIRKPHRQFAWQPGQRHL